MAPDYRVVLANSQEPVPDNSQMAKLEKMFKDKVPILFSIGRFLEK